MKRAELNIILKRMEAFADPKAVEGMARFGIVARKAYGLSTPKLRKLAREIGKDHALAQQLWSTGIFDARILAALIDEPKMITETQMEQWVKDFDNWAICDTCCSNLFAQTPFAWNKAIEWCRQEEEFVKRAGFVMMAELAVHDKSAIDRNFLKFFPVMKRHARDERNFVKKAINWALRQIGKRNSELNRRAIQVAKQIQKMDSPSAHWIAADALRELSSTAVQQRLKKMESLTTNKTT